MQANGSIVAIRDAKKTPKRSRRTTQEQSNNDEPSLVTTLVTQFEMSAGTFNESPESDLAYNKTAEKNSSESQTAEKNSSESLFSMQSLEPLDPIKDNTAIVSNPPEADESPKSLNDDENSQTEFKEEIIEEGEIESTDDEHDDESQTIKELSATNFFEACQVDVPYQNQKQIPLFKIPIDFKFKNRKLQEQELSEQEYKNARLSLPKEERKKLMKKTPKIFYLSTFDRLEYDKIRKRMRNKISKEDLKCTSKSEFKRQLILYPECFLLVPISDKRQKMMDEEFDKALFYEIIQFKQFPEKKDFDHAYLDQTFEPDKDQSWFKIDESENFHPETG